MTWSLSAAGHAITDTGKEYMAEAQKLEAELVAELNKVLSNPKWGTSSSLFQGNTVTGPVHTTDSSSATAAPAPAADTGSSSSSTAASS